MSASDSQRNHDHNTARAKSVWSDLPRRLATICIGFPVIWALLARPTLARLFFMGAHALSLWEFTLLEPPGDKSNDTSTSTRLSLLPRVFYCTMSVLMATMTTKNDSFFHLLFCFTTGVFVWLDRRHWILGLVVVTIPFRIWIGLAPHDFPSTISLLLVVWNCDTGALIVGRLSSKLGLPRMPVPLWIQKISPAKSMEGFLGGILGGIWTATSWVPLLTRLAALETTEAFDSLWESYSSRMALGVSLSILGIIGDLVESAIKRQSQTKDSGSFLPGHGGVLDRFDSSLLAVLLYQVLLEGN